MRLRRVTYAVELTIVTLVVVLMILPACRKEVEPLDRNRPPETFLTTAPPETTSADYRVHLYWHGVDKDGVVTKFMWYRSDTLFTLDPIGEPDIELLDWNPEARKDDYLKGRFTTKTDTIFIFTGFDTNTGAMQNRQAFHIVAVDDGGMIDPSPKRLQFFARVKGIPKVKFWTQLDPGEPPQLYDSENLDTIAMFTPFKLFFTAGTVNNIISGYRWIYSGVVRPDFNNDGVPDWYVPVFDPPETVAVELTNAGEEMLPSGDFYFRVIARDEAGALSKSDIITGEGACNIVINHDPDTRIFRAECFFRNKRGVDSMIVLEYDELFDVKPDTLPYYSRLRFHYAGWDDPKDIATLQYPPPNEVPIRFQFMFERFGIDENQNTSSYATPWYPTARAEDTNRFADEDSTTMRVGTYGYMFAVRSFDEQYRSDGTPDSVHFYGNFPPTIDTIEIGYDAAPLIPTLYFTPLSGDTLYIGLDKVFQFRPDTASAWRVDYDGEKMQYTYHYKMYLKGNGHDDDRDPPGSGIKGWKFIINGPKDYYYRKENEWVYDNAVDEYLQELNFQITVPFDTTTNGPDYSLINNPPGFLGPQYLEIRAKDINDKQKFLEGIRAISPVYDPATDSLITAGKWIEVQRSPENYARLDYMIKPLYIKLVQ